MGKDFIENFLSYLRNERRYSELTVRAYRYDICQFGFFLLNGQLPQPPSVKGRSGSRSHTVGRAAQAMTEEQMDQSLCFDVRLVATEDLKRWLMSLNAAGYKPSSVNRAISSLRALFRWLCREGVLESNPIAKISNIKQPSRLPVVLIFMFCVKGQ